MHNRLNTTVEGAAHNGNMRGVVKHHQGPVELGCARSSISEVQKCDAHELSLFWPTL